MAVASQIVGLGGASPRSAPVVHWRSTRPPMHPASSSFVIVNLLVFAALLFVLRRRRHQRREILRGTETLGPG